MADRNVSIEISAQDAASPVLDDAARKGEAAAAKLRSAAQNASEGAVKGFSALRALSAALRGDFAAAGMELAKLSASFRASGANGVVALGAVSAAATSLVRLAKSAKDLFATAFNLDQAPRALRDASSALRDLDAHAANFAAHMDAARENAARLTSQFEAESALVERLAKAQAEFARQQELALADSDSQREEINQRYDSSSARIGEDSAAARRERLRSDLDDEIRRIEGEIEAAEKAAEDYSAAASRLTKAAAARQRDGSGLWGGLKGLFGSNTELDEALRLSNAATEARNRAEEMEQRLDDLKSRLDDARHRRRLSDIEEESAQEESFARQQRERNDAHARILRADVAERRADEAEAARAAAALAYAQRSAEAELLRIRRASLAEAQAIAQASSADQAAAASRLAAARQQSAVAWGWYRDRGSMAAQLKEEAENERAERQFVRDFERLKGFKGRDWREAKNLSVDEEAVRRVALAREEENAAQRELEKLSSLLEEQNDLLKQLLQGGGE